jgi:hypothetical protein
MINDLSVKISAIVLFIALPVTGYLAQYWISNKQNTAAYQLSLSSDGRYVIGNRKNEMILWDIETRTRKRIAKNVNIYSAYFVKNSPHYLYQDLNNIVHLKNLEGKEAQSFTLDFPTYGHLVTSDLSRYFASDKDWRIIKREQGVETIIKGLDSPDGFSNGKLLNLFLSDDEKMLLSVGISLGGSELSRKILFEGDEISKMQWPHHLSSFTLWDAIGDNPKLLFRFLEYKSTGGISPSSTKLIAADENGYVSIIDIKTHEYSTFNDFYDTVVVYPKEEGQPLQEIKKYFYPEINKKEHQRYTTGALRILFLSPTEYLKINAHSTFAFLYSLDSVVPLAYLDLGSKPFPNVHDYSRNGAMDSAPAAHRFVIGKHNESGILVYDYDPQARTLTKIWDAR